MELLDRAYLRRVALARQGLAVKLPFGKGIAATLKAIQHLSHVQIDTISVVARAHNHILYSRVPDFSPNHISRLLERRSIFEYRFPVAAFRPIEDYRFTLPHAARFREKPRAADKSMMRRIVDRISEQGALRSRDFEQDKKKGGSWWDWKPAKLALEQLYFQGDLMISARDGFEKSYDLTERVLPSWVGTSKPTPSEFAAHLIDSTLRFHGFSSYATFAAGARHVPLGNSLKEELKCRVGDGRLCQFVNDEGVGFWAEPDIFSNRKPRVGKQVHTLSPFDKLIIQRERLREVFDFEYLLECYVPEPKRKFGYYCLPVIHGDQFVARMDCKSHRDSGCFEIKEIFLEPDFLSQSKVTEIAPPFAKAVKEYAHFDGCDEVTISRAQPAWAKQILKKAVDGI